MGTGIYVYDGCTVESVGSTRAMDIFSGRAPLVEHSRKIIWLVEEERIGRETCEILEKMM